MTRQAPDPETRAGIARAIEAFYDAHPYPPPVEGLDAYREAWADPHRRRADFHLHWPRRPYTEGLSVLVAGCGTSQAAKHAARRPEGRVVGIDVSRSSLRETEALQRKHGLDHLEIRHLPVERVEELGERFDLVVCTGVLHHLPEPAAGLEALRRVLEPDGALHLMVYAPYGRTGIYMLQDYARRLGVGTSRDEVQALAETLLALPRDHPLAPLLARAPDFRTRAGLADALLNPCDRAFTVPQLLELIAGAGLQLGRWVRQAPYLPACGAVAETPHGERLRGLPDVEQYAAMELFRGTMVRHSVIVHRDDAPGGPRALGLDDVPWSDLVPLRVPGSACVEERLPAGAAAVLVNRGHRDPDLVVPIDAAEKRRYDAIDGRRTIEEITGETTSEAVTPRDRESAQGLFRRLWLHDHVVFDGSRAAPLSDERSSEA